MGTPTTCPIDPVFRADSVTLAISVEKDGNLRVVYAGSDAYFAC
jgi:hypothetical protein